MNIQPKFNKVLIEPQSAEKQTAGGIIIPDTAKEKQKKGTIIKVGEGAFEAGIWVPMNFKEGDSVLYNKYAGTELEIEGKVYLVMGQTDILCTL